MRWRAGGWGGFLVSLTLRLHEYVNIVFTGRYDAILSGKCCVEWTNDIMDVFQWITLTGLTQHWSWETCYGIPSGWCKQRSSISLWQIIRRLLTAKFPYNLCFHNRHFMTSCMQGLRISRAQALDWLSHRISSNSTSPVHILLVCKNEHEPFYFRGKKHLLISHTRTRTEAGFPLRRQSSPWILRGFPGGSKQVSPPFRNSSWSLSGPR